MPIERYLQPSNGVVIHKEAPNLFFYHLKMKLWLVFFCLMAFNPSIDDLQCINSSESVAIHNIFFYFTDNLALHGFPIWGKTRLKNNSTFSSRLDEKVTSNASFCYMYYVVPWFRATHPSRADEDKTLTFVPFWPESRCHYLKIITKIEIKRQLHGQIRSFSFSRSLDSPVRFFSLRFLSPYLDSNEGLRRFRKRKKFQDERMRNTERKKCYFLSPIFMSD